MKKILPLILLVAAGGAAYIALLTKEATYVAPQAGEVDTIPLVLASQPAPGEQVVRFDVEGMCCGGCRPKVYEAAKRIAGVRDAAVEIGKLSVIVPASADLAALEKTLTFDDYVAHVQR